MNRVALKHLCLSLTIISLVFSTPLMGQVGPDVITGILFGARQLAREGAVGSGTLGIGVSTTSCNHGDMGITLHRLPEIDHPAMWGNMYRLETVDGSQCLEQIGQSWFKHSFGTSNSNECNLGCPNPSPFDQITPLCSDTYGASQFDACGLGGATEGLMGPRSAVHPYTGVFRFSGPELGSGGGCPINFPAANHINHNHEIVFGRQGPNDIQHRLQVPDVDIDPILHPGARYFQEGGYITGSEFLSGNGNQNNNVSHREIGVVDHPNNGAGWHLFPNLSSTFEASPAIDAWPGASQTIIEPAPLADGRGIMAYQVTDLGGGTWHYEYAIFNQFNDASFGSFSVPIPAGVTVSNIGFHAPLNHAPAADADNYDNEPWVSSVTGGSITWTTDDFSIDPMANAIRWGTTYNFRFDADTPPQGVFATVELFKRTGSVRAATLGPQAVGQTDCNNNGIDDTCELDCNAAGCAGVKGCGTATDCDGTGVPDECEIDCNGNGVHDGCDISGGSSPDCTENGIPDECEVDCDNNGIADSCDIKSGAGIDCNGDGVLDSCPIPPGGDADNNNNGIPDVCECSAPIVPAEQETVIPKNRYLTIRGNPGSQNLVQVTLSVPPAGYESSAGFSYWVTNPVLVSENSGSTTPQEGFGTFLLSSLSCEPKTIFWGGFDQVDVFSPAILPGATYEIRHFSASCPTGTEPVGSAPVTVTTSIWGDLIKDCMVTPCGPPDGSVDVTTDVTSLLDKFKNLPNAPRKARTDIEPRIVDRIINITDVTFALDAFSSLPYSFAGPTPCPAAE